MPQKKLMQKQGPSPQNEEQAPPEQTGEERRSEEIYHSGSVTTQGGRHKIHCLTIIGQVEGLPVCPPPAAGHAERAAAVERKGGAAAVRKNIII